MTKIKLIIKTIHNVANGMRMANRPIAASLIVAWRAFIASIFSVIGLSIFVIFFTPSLNVFWVRVGYVLIAFGGWFWAAYEIRKDWEIEAVYQSGNIKSHNHKANSPKEP